MRSNSRSREALRGQGSRIIVAGCAVIFALTLHATYDMSDPNAYRLPRVMAFTGLAVAILEWAVGSKPRAGPAEPAKSVGVPVPASIGFAAAYFALVPLLGFVLATALAVAAFGALARFERRGLLAVLAVAVPMILYLTFGKLLQAPLPTGLLGSLRF